MEQGIRFAGKLILPIAGFGISTVVHAEIERKIDFARDIKPIFEASCVGCHGENDKERGGKFRLDSREAAFKGGKTYNPAITPGDSGETPVWWMTTLIPEDDDYDEVMPPKHQQPLNRHQQDLLEAWVEQGANWPDDMFLAEGSRVNFTAAIAPIFQKGGPIKGRKLDIVKLWAEQSADWPEGGEFDQGDKPKVPIISPKTKQDFASVIGPLLKRGGPFNDPEVQVIRRWAEAGAPWEDGFLLGEFNLSRSPDNLELVKRIHTKIIETTKEKSESEMEPCTETIVKTGVPFEMVPIKGGRFLMGSPVSEKDRKDDEGPQREVEIKPFWMGRFEVTWDEYRPFMGTGNISRNKDGSPQNWSSEAPLEDLVSSPTTAYTEMSFGMGIQRFPAICMTQHAALKFCQWISAQTGHYYRLPTEAEWEYACRAGTGTAFSWGDDPKQAGKYAWFYDNSRDKYQKVGEKEPNPWGLHDMHGNVLEWTLDAYGKRLTGGEASGLSPYVKPGEDLYPRIVRGGSWYDYPEDLRSAKRYATHPDWKKEDPQLPKSLWYLTDANWLGMRLVRPLEIPGAENMHEIWNSGRGEENEVEGAE